MTKYDVKRFLDENNIKYEEEVNGQFTYFRLPDYNILNICCYYWRCEIEFKGENDIETYPMKLDKEYLKEFNYM